MNTYASFLLAAWWGTGSITHIKPSLTFHASSLTFFALSTALLLPLSSLLPFLGWLVCRGGWFIGWLVEAILLSFWLPLDGVPRYLVMSSAMLQGIRFLGLVLCAAIIAGFSCSLWCLCFYIIFWWCLQFLVKFVFLEWQGIMEVCAILLSMGLLFFVGCWVLCVLTCLNIFLIICLL